VSRKRLQIDWVAVLVNGTLVIASVMFIAAVGTAVWWVY
jgi:hypothetical protein